MKRDDRDVLDRTEAGLERSEGDDKADDRAVGVADLETAFERADFALMWDEVEMVEIDGRDNEGD